METSLAKEKGKEVWVKCGCSEGWEVPRESFSGGLVLAWMLKQRLKVVYESKNLVHTDLLNNKCNPLSITFVYGHHELSNKEVVWQKLRSLKSLAQPNWLCIGDFNQILV